MPFVVQFSIDEDKMGPEDSRAGTLSVSYSDPPEAEVKLGHWRYSERYEAGDPNAADEICAQFEAWKAKRTIEVGIESALKSELDPLCPCHEPPEEPSEPETPPE